MSVTYTIYLELSGDSFKKVRNPKKNSDVPIYAIKQLLLCSTAYPKGK